MLKACRIVQWGTPAMLVFGYVIGFPTAPIDVAAVMTVAWIAKTIGDGLQNQKTCHENMAKYIAAGGLTAPPEQRKLYFDRSFSRHRLSRTKLPSFDGGARWRRRRAAAPSGGDRRASASADRLDHRHRQPERVDHSTGR